MGNKKLTNKEIRIALDDTCQAVEALKENDTRLSDNCQILDQKFFQIANAFNLYLKYCGEEDKFTKFVKEEIDRSEEAKKTNKEGA